MVSIGNQLGRKLDFPTINIYPTEYKLLPPNGVYATQTTIDGEKFYGVTNLGTKPTVSDAPEISVETFLFDFDKDVYGKKVDVEETDCGRFGFCKKYVSYWIINTCKGLMPVLQ